MTKLHGNSWWEREVEADAAGEGTVKLVLTESGGDGIAGGTTCSGTAVGGTSSTTTDRGEWLRSG